MFHFGKVILIPEKKNCILCFYITYFVSYVTLHTTTNIFEELIPHPSTSPTLRHPTLIKCLFLRLLCQLIALNDIQNLHAHIAQVEGFQKVTFWPLKNIISENKFQNVAGRQ
jgi:hypothetical protein